MSIGPIGDVQRWMNLQQGPILYVFLPMAKKLYQPEFWFRAPKFFKIFPKMVKNSNLFIIQARTFKFWWYRPIAYTTLMSYPLKKYDLGGSIWAIGAPKCQILTLLFFGQESSKFWNILLLWTKIQFSWKIVVRGPRLGTPGPQSVKIIKF